MAAILPPVWVVPQMMSNGDQLVTWLGFGIIAGLWLVLLYWGIRMSFNRLSFGQHMAERPDITPPSSPSPTWFVQAMGDSVCGWSARRGPSCLLGMTGEKEIGRASCRERL